MDSITKFLARHWSDPTLRTDRQWLLKYDDGEKRIWMNDVSKRVQVKIEILQSDRWVPVKMLIDGQWQDADPTHI